MNLRMLIYILIFSLLIIVPGVMADTLQNDTFGYETGTDAAATTTNTFNTWCYLVMNNFDTYNEVTLYTTQVTGNYFYSGSGPFTAKIGTDLVGQGTYNIFNVSTTVQQLGLEFTSWDRLSYTGTQYVNITFGGNDITVNTFIGAVNAGPFHLSLYNTAGHTFRATSPTIYYRSQFSIDYSVNQTDDFATITFDRTNTTYPSSARVTATQGAATIVNEYKTSGTTTFYGLGSTPIYGSVLWDGAGGYRNFTIYVSGEDWVFIPNATAVPTTVPTNAPLTATVTATPTPIPASCGYWTVTPANTSIFRGQNVTYTLTETDPDNAFAKIEYYKILPNGAKIPDISYVKDNYGLFGLGVTWVAVDPVTDAATVSSEAAAKSHEMWFNISGKNYAQIDILDDKSWLGAIGIHDWQIVCSIIVDVNVGGPSNIPPSNGPDGIPDTGDEPEIDPGPDGIEGTPDDILPDEYYAKIGINVWEMDTKAIVYGTTICVYDYSTGAWANQSNGAGGATTYFYVTPLRNIRVYVDKSPWVVFDQTFQVPNPPGTYGVYLKRPMVTTGTNTSYVVFAVKASEKLFPLSGATIKISNATWNTTIATNSAGGAQTELPEGETYNYLINRYGYLKVSNYFDVTVDDLYMTVTMNVDPGNPPEYVQPTWTEIIINTGTATPTPAGAGGVSPVGTGTTYRANNLEYGMNVWYDRFGFLQELFFLVVVVGALGLMMKSIPGSGGRRRR